MQKYALAFFLVTSALISGEVRNVFNTLCDEIRSISSDEVRGKVEHLNKAQLEKLRARLYSEYYGYELLEGSLVGAGISAALYGFSHIPAWVAQRTASIRDKGIAMRECYAEKLKADYAEAIAQAHAAEGFDEKTFDALVEPMNRLADNVHEIRSHQVENEIDREMMNCATQVTQCASYIGVVATSSMFATWVIKRLSLPANVPNVLQALDICIARKLAE